VNQLINDPRKTIEMGKNARKKAEALYGFDEHYAKLMKLYDETTTAAHQKN